MAKGDFICSNCKEVGSSARYKYQCSKHRNLCEGCVETSFWSDKAKCKKCLTGALRFEYNRDKDKWLQT